MIQKLVGSNWGSDAQTLRVSALSLVFSAAEYCCSVWSRSCHIHLVDVQLNQVMRTISGCVRSTPVPWLSVLSNIAPPSIRRTDHSSKLIVKVTRLDNSLLSLFLKDDPGQRLKSRQPIQVLLSNFHSFDIRTEWKQFWDSAAVFNHELIDDPTVAPGGFNLQRRQWITLNRLRTGHGKCGHCLFKWGLVDSTACDCGAVDQTMAHLVLSCPLRRFSGTLFELSAATTERSIDWLTNLDILL